MKFLLTRSSNSNTNLNNINVDKEKYKLSYEKYDTVEYYYGTPEKYKECMGKGWFDKGVDHTENEKYIQRRIINGAEGVFIELNTLEELLEFEKDYGSIIISNTYENRDVEEIEIYDCYRE